MKLNNNKKVMRSALMVSVLMFGGSFQAQCESWFVGIDAAVIDAELTERDNTVGFTLGFLIEDHLSVELSRRTITGGDLSGSLDSAMLVWRSSDEGFYGKIGAGVTFASDKIFEGNSGTVDLGMGYQFNEAWSLELDAIRVSNDVNAVSLSTQFRF